MHVTIDIDLVETVHLQPSFLPAAITFQVCLCFMLITPLSKLLYFLVCLAPTVNEKLLKYATFRL